MDKKEFSAKKLSEETGIGLSGVYRFMNGDMPQARTLKALCRVLDVSADYLLDLRNSPEYPLETPARK